MKKMKKIVEVETRKIIIDIPINTVELKLSATVLMEDKENEEMELTLNLQDIYKGFKDVDDNYDDPDCMYKLTEQGRQYIESLIKERREQSGC